MSLADFYDVAASGDGGQSTLINKLDREKNKKQKQKHHC